MPTLYCQSAQLSDTFLLTAPPSGQAALQFKAMKSMTFIKQLTQIPLLVSTIYIAVFTSAAVAANTAPIWLTAVNDLDFGQVCQGEISRALPENDRAAGFFVQGDAWTMYTSYIPFEMTLQHVSHEESTVHVDEMFSTSQGMLDALGEDEFEVGATAWVRVDQVPGLYTGTFWVQAHYMPQATSQDSPDKLEPQAAVEANASIEIIQCEEK